MTADKCQVFGQSTEPFLIVPHSNQNAGEKRVERLRLNAIKIALERWLAFGQPMRMQQGLLNGSNLFQCTCTDIVGGLWVDHCSKQFARAQDATASCATIGKHG